MNKRVRQYLGILAALVAYYFVHEGAHLICALAMGVFRQINWMGIGIQIDVDHTVMTNMQMGRFCLVGAAATLIAGYVLVFFCDAICGTKSRLLKAAMYYVTIAMLLLDPLYLSLLCGFFGGGDMNGISLLCPETAARIGFGILFIVNGYVFGSRVLPKYTKAFQK